MNITLSIEELKQYQSRVHDWLLSAVQSKTIIRATDEFDLKDLSRSQDPWRDVRASAKTWVEENPMPKLVPKELEA